MDSAASALERARLSLTGLSVGDGFGQALAFSHWSEGAAPGLPAAPWSWTDDTHMALSIVEVLEHHGVIDQDALAAAFARRFAEDPGLGYGMGALRLLRRMAMGADWREIVADLFPGGEARWEMGRRCGPARSGATSAATPRAPRPKLAPPRP